MDNLWIKLDDEAERVAFDQWRARRLATIKPAPPANQVRRSLTPKAMPTSMQPYRAHELANGNSVGMDENVPPPWI